MQHSKKFYVIDERGLDRIRRVLPTDSATPLKRFNEAFIEGFGELVFNLISNREAKKYLNTEMAKLESVRTSTPRSDRLPSSSRNLALSGLLENLESDDETFKEARDIIDSAVKTKRGNNKRIKWTSLFAKKNGRKQKGRKYK